MTEQIYKLNPKNELNIIRRTLDDYSVKFSKKRLSKIVKPFQDRKHIPLVGLD